jgi:hypothetical protein
MRQVTKWTVYVILGVAVALLALGALPGLLKSGDPYYLTAAPAPEVDNRATVDASTLSTDRFPYATGALVDATPDAPGRSAPYWRGPIGLKGAFTHSPFDEHEALGQQHAEAADDGTVYARHDGVVYRLTIVQESR